MNAEIYCQKFSSNLLECLLGSTRELLGDFGLELLMTIKLVIDKSYYLWVCQSFKTINLAKIK
jgi:hypothetical protein